MWRRSWREMDENKEVDESCKSILFANGSASQQLLRDLPAFNNKANEFYGTYYYWNTCSVMHQIDIAELIRAKFSFKEK